MIKSKKGALELSVNTIVVIVIGVTLLTLGLVFVRGIIDQTKDISDRAFQQANQELDALGGGATEILTIAPQTVRVDAGDTTGFTVLIKNVEQNPYSGITANIKNSEAATRSNVRCEFSDGSISKQIRSPLGVGAEDRYNIRVRTTKSSIGSFGCEFSLSGGGVEQSTFSTRRDIEIIVR